MQVLEQREDGWAEILCSNGWTAWLNGRALEPLAFFVPASGLPAWPSPDGAAAPVANLGPGLDVQVIEHRRDGWARIRCSNGWTAWVDGRLLVAGGSGP